MTAKIIGSFPPVGGTVNESGINTMAHATAQNPVGALYTVKDDTTDGLWSVVRYYQAGATILQGDALCHDTSQYKPYRFLRTPLTEAGLMPRGVAAANVSNTAYYSFCYISGYCPTIKFGSGVTSNSFNAVSASFTGAFGSFGLYSTVSTNVTVRLGIVYSLDVNTTTGVNSGIIQGFLL